MKKKDLKSGMVVETKNGARLIVLTNCKTMGHGNQDFCFINKRGFLIGDAYGDNLTHLRDSTWDIIKVYNPNVNECTHLMTNLEIIWKRKKLEETITIGQYTYDKAEFEAATQHLKPLNY